MLPVPVCERFANPYKVVVKDAGPEELVTTRYRNTPQCSYHVPGMLETCHFFIF